MSDPRIHTCPGGCGASVPNHLFACRTDWWRLPWDIRQDILITYRYGPAAAMQHLEAMQRAKNWYRQAVRP